MSSAGSDCGLWNPAGSIGQLSPTSSGSSFSFRPHPVSPKPPDEPPASDPLFDTPADLVCPITHEIFRDPVINAAGQVYEREAIEQALQHQGLDPVTRMVLPTPHLTPVYILRSRAMEYRDNTARACIEHACSPTCRDPVRYVRRAAELCTTLSSPVQGLSVECLQYVQSHPSNAYDMLALQLFAKGLFDAGYRDKAASVYYTLLQTGVDRTQQAELLRQCLACWTAGLDGEPDINTFEKLAQFVESQQTFSWGQIIDIVQEAGLGVRFTIQLIEQLLFKMQRPEGDGMELQEWRKQKELLVKYVQILCEDLASQIPKPELVAAPSAQPHAESPAKEPGAPHHRHWAQRMDWSTSRKAAAAVFTAASLLRSDRLLVRVARVVPLLFLLHPRERS